MDKKDGFKPYLPLTFLIGFGFFTMGLMDPLYDNYLPKFLGDYIGSKFIIGGVMTLDNVFALFMIPLVSVISDRTRTRIGRRMPYIITLLPATAVCFGLLPYAAGVSLAVLIALVFLLNVFKQAARGPVVALMPDSIPGDYRSEANGVINTMGGIASIVGTIGLARLMNVDLTLPMLGATKNRLPFPIAGFLVVVAVILVFAFVREKKADEDAAEEKVPLFSSFKAIAGSGDRSALLILASIFLWFLGYQGVLPFLGRYGVEELGLSEGVTAFSSGMVGIAYALFAIPSGYIAHKFGRRSTIRFSLAALVAVMIAIFLQDRLGAMMGPANGTRTFVFWGLLFLFGAFWVTVITNSFPMLWQMASFGTMGVYTGLYYTFSQAAAIASPPMTGGLIDLFGYSAMFAFCAVCMLAAFIVMSFVKRGEAGEKAVSRD
ncbi:MAG: MFS transporter [Spirochaetes bacterium]|nr:MFS transporter [Spirochaetota bacterium]